MNKDKQYRVEWCGRIQVFVPIKDGEPTSVEGLETTPNNAWLRNVKG